ncbi:MAG: sugar ABC transporter ATP-binding protein [Acidobacteriota bacterium]|nr:sugar ABC transporter ATP-binding protein [Acidobacteriota bacterium]
MPGLHALAFRDVRKAFGAVQALKGVSFDVAEGGTHAIVGENGAGKSTLLKILAGLMKPDAGTIAWHGAPLHASSPREALERGIGMVYQEMLAFPNLTVAANIFAGREITRRGWLRERAMRDRTRAILDELHLDVDPSARAESLPAAHRQLLQVARAMAFDCRILVLDEPTTALTDAETDHLFAVVSRLKARGVTILYVSHRLPDVFRLCDRITVLRDGAHVETFSTAGATPACVVRAMVGRDLPTRASGPVVDLPFPIRPVALEVERLTRRPCFRDVSLHVRAGEIVALFGLVGSGRSELVETIFGIFAPQAGRVRVDGAPAAFRSPVDAARAGLALVPEERQRQGLFFNLTLGSNLVLPLRRITGARRIRAREDRADAERLIDAWRIRTSGPDASPDSLSGGNQQKAVLAKWLAARPRVLMLDEPTKGVDVGAKFEIHAVIRREAAAGTACLIVSSDLPEVLALADRVIVMREGRVQGELAGAAATEEAVMHMATSDVSAAS